MKVNIHAAKTTLSKLIERARAGEEVIIAKADVPVARLVAIVGPAPPKRQPGTWKGKLDLPPDFLDPLPDEELDLWDGGTDKK
jgi:prevent-host-death family protein